MMADDSLEQTRQVLTSTLSFCISGKYLVSGEVTPCWCQEGEATREHTEDCLRCLKVWKEGKPKK